jgi:hypothetical protein
MGAGAHQRGDKSIRRGLWQEIDERSRNQEAVRIVLIAEDCNKFAREAMSYLVEPRGLRQATVERARTRRGWKKRNDAVCTAHGIWVDVDYSNANAYAIASVKRATAIYDLLIFALGCWTIPDHISVPRAVTK